MKQNHTYYTGRVKYSSMLSFLDISHMSLIACIKNLGTQMMWQVISRLYYINPKKIKNLNLNLNFPSPSQSQTRVNAGKLILQQKRRQKISIQQLAILIQQIHQLIHIFILYFHPLLTISKLRLNLKAFFSYYRKVMYTGNSMKHDFPQTQRFKEIHL